MQDEMRGVIRNRKFATQIRDFSGLLFGSITPTDIDGFIEYKNECFIFIESKHGNAQMPFGQRLAFERLADSCSKIKPTLFILASHNTEDDIDFANCAVTQYRVNEIWSKTNKTITIKDFIMDYLNNGYLVLP